MLGAFLKNGKNNWLVKIDSCILTMSSNWEIISAFGVQYIFGNFQKMGFVQKTEVARKVYDAAYAFRGIRAPVAYHGPHCEDEARRWSRLVVDAVKSIPGVKLYTPTECSNLVSEFMRGGSAWDQTHVDFLLPWCSAQGWKYAPLPRTA